MTQEPLILAIETSGRLGSVAIAAGPQLMAETEFSAPIRHSAEIFPAICGLLERFGKKPGEIDHVYISGGPGSFTGLRIAVTIAKIMSLANSIKIVSVGTLDAIAANATDCIEEKHVKIEKIGTVLDAKRGQFFVAEYENQMGQWKKILPDCLMTAPKYLETIAGSAEPIWLLGEGLVYYKDKFNADGIKFLDEKYWAPKAAKIHLLGWQKALAGGFAEPLMLGPDYLRRPII